MSDRQSHQDLKEQKLLTTAEGIAKHLGEDWSLQPPSPDWGGCVVYLDGPRGQSFEICDRPGRKTAEIRGGLPKLPCGNPVFLRQEDKERCRIRASLKRRPADLAREISRRLLPGYRQVFEAVRRQVEQVEIRNRSANSLLHELASMCRIQRPTERQIQNHEVTLRDLRGSIKVSQAPIHRAAPAHLTLQLPGPVAVEVLELVTARCPELAAQG